jgi:hypothetical protein
MGNSRIMTCITRRKFARLAGAMADNIAAMHGRLPDTDQRRRMAAFIASL